jgi:putative ABC transport system permease protein
MRDFWRDIRYGVRASLSSPTSTIIMIGALALGIGANCAVFGLINAVLLRPLPYKDGDRLVRIHSLNPSLNISTSDVSPSDFTDWRTSCNSFENIAAFLVGGSIIKVGDETERVQAAGVTADFFPLFGVNPIAGRHFLPEEDKPESNGAAILSYNLWTRLFGADPHVIGRSISLNERSVIIVGVMPQGFSYPAGNELWTSLGLDDNYPRGNRFLQIVGRLKGTTLPESAQAEIDSVTSRLAQDYPKTNQGWKAELIPLNY